jgi:hypothetical protein
MKRGETELPARAGRTWSFMWLFPGNNRGLNDRLLGHIGVTSNASTDGWTMGPPADKEYAVEPVGVEIINPSDWKRYRARISDKKCERVL